MDNEQKQSIQALRSLGRTYRQIADHTGLSENTVKSFCHRNNVAKKFCKNCGKPLAGEAGHKPRTFCCDRCRQAWWRKNRDQLCKKAVYRFICANCGNPFESYGNRDRKYCSRGCYLAHRYGVP
jgi:endogenous inhibitor of DNA gyrase (YacG/DUF329 family)